MRLGMFYFQVRDLAVSVDFYEKLLGVKASVVKGDRWAEFGEENEPGHFGLMCDGVEIDGRGGAVLNFYSGDVERDFLRAKEIGAEVVYEPCRPDSYYPDYVCFEILDLDGNRVEVASGHENEKEKS